MTSDIEKIIGPRIVFAGSFVLDNQGVRNISIPPLSGVKTDYVTLVNNAKLVGFEIGSIDTKISLKGATGDSCSVVIIKAGMAI